MSLYRKHGSLQPFSESFSYCSRVVRWNWFLIPRNGNDVDGVSARHLAFSGNAVYHVFPRSRRTLSPAAGHPNHAKPVRSSIVFTFFVYIWYNSPQLICSYNICADICCSLLVRLSLQPQVALIPTVDAGVQCSTLRRAGSRTSTPNNGSRDRHPFLFPAST